MTRRAISAEMNSDEFVMTASAEPHVPRLGGGTNSAIVT